MPLFVAMGDAVLAAEVLGLAVALAEAVAERVAVYEGTVATSTPTT